MSEINIEVITKPFELDINIFKTCFPTDGKDFSAPLANSFERCSYFLIVDSNQTKDFIVLLNDVQTAARGAGIQIAQLIIDLQIKVVIVPEIDSIAFDILKKAGVEIYLGIDGSIQENLNLYRQGRLVKINF